MKRSELFFSVAQVLVDAAMIVLAGVFAYVVRDVPQIIELRPKLYNYAFSEYFKILLAITPLFILVFAVEGLYKIRVTRRFREEVKGVFMATAVAFVIIVVAIFLKRSWFSSRFIILSGWATAVFLVVFGRLLLKSIQSYLLVNKKIGAHRLLLIGRNGQLDVLNRRIKRNPQWGYRVVDHIQNAYVREVKRIKQDKGIDDIIVCEPTIPDSDLEKLIDFSHINNISFKFIPTTLQTSKYIRSELAGELLLEVPNTPLEGWGRIVKRIFDIAGSVFGIIITSPILALTAIAIKLDSRGPIIYKNERVGADGKPFFVYKFRYMKWECCISHENEKIQEALKLEKELIAKKSVRKGPLYKIKCDPRKTRVGRFIEKYSIDELPQFFNVLFGSMSLVGPRPHQKREVEGYKEYHRRLLTIKPGVTGLAQVYGRSDLDFEDEYRYDVYYIENWSLGMDLGIILKTVGVLFNKRRNI